MRCSLSLPVWPCMAVHALKALLDFLNGERTTSCLKACCTEVAAGPTGTCMWR